ncbi:MAG: Permease of the drug/metabolite transporter (DMT) superfamily [uncultured Solirubrobacteraceae bacterium]|uniref:Permease of the drug/metabolite transporter (DMT) superfamily n=1 Tax=uncultured Solirubrobacteraceae bacterium TaxID=1162706 RepID=A0A6J4RIH7_9ACTN|nr:MAG: Permease of the drug/metabolite transporter (DMT) superfamily [uncultured Solirubrobacteraceae bacterium]
MSAASNAISIRAVTRPGAGLLLGLLGVLGFSFSLPATRLAVTDLDPWFVTFARAAVAAALAGLYLLAVRAPLPTRAQWRRLALVAGGAVVGFPLLTGLALVTSESQQGAVVVTLLPAATALAAVVLAGERPGPVFWAAAVAGLLIVLTFTVATSGGAVTGADVFLLAAVAVCAVAYAEGGVLSRDLGGARTICWALVLSVPITVPIAAAAAATTSLQAGPGAWLGLAYVSAISMFLGFFAWYAGLARGGVARVGQVQLLQPLLTFLWAGLVLGERIGAGTVLAATAVLATVVVTQRARITHQEHRGGGAAAPKG